MFKTLTDATYFLARQALQLRKERVYFPEFGRAVRRAVASLSYASKSENDPNKTHSNFFRQIMVCQKIVE